MEDILNKHMSSLSEIDKLLYLSGLVKSSVSDYRKKEKALKIESEFSYMSAPKRTAKNRGGKLTSLSARASINCQMYHKGIQDIKKVIKYL
jgi:hypothetical protein